MIINCDPGIEDSLAILIGGGILMLTVFTLLLGYNLKVAVGTSTMIMTANMD